LELGTFINRKYNNNLEIPFFYCCSTGGGLGFQELLSTSNGQDIVAVIQSRHCIAVSNGSFKESFGTAALIITDDTSGKLAGHITVPQQCK